MTVFTLPNNDLVDIDHLTISIDMNTHIHVELESLLSLDVYPIARLVQGELIYEFGLNGWQGNIQHPIHIALLPKLLRLQHVANRRRRDIVQEWRKRPHATNKGFIYVIESKTPARAYKIGMTTKPKERFKNFGVKLPFDIEVVCVIPTRHMRAAEANLHHIFEHKRVGGEWFDLSFTEVCNLKETAITFEDAFWADYMDIAYYEPPFGAGTNVNDVISEYETEASHE